MKVRFFLMIIGLFWLRLSHTQAQDSLTYFTLEDFYGLILQNHPVVKQAKLLEQNAQQEIRLARGAFDPKLMSDYDNKNFKGTEYWDIWQHELKVPVWFNTDLKVQYNKANGQYVGEDLANTEDGLLAVGISVPIGRGMFIDQRRAALRQAELMTDMAEAERIKMINKVLLQAAKDYWEWYYTYAEYQIRVQAFDLADFRFNGVKQNVVNGDQAPIDSVEAKITVQNRFIEQEQSWIEFKNASLLISNYLWDPNNSPLELSENIRPTLNETIEYLSEQELNDLITQAKEQHPEIRKLNAKYKQYEIEQRLNRENLKPQLTANYNFLTNQDVSAIENGILFEDNYKFGFEFSLPLFLRKERAKLQKTNLKLIENNLERNITRREIANEINATHNTMINLRDMVNLQELMVSNYETLVNGEITKFENGESSLFLVNSRESKLIEAQSKLLKLKVSYEKEKAFLMWSAGITDLGLTSLLQPTE